MSLKKRKSLGLGEMRGSQVSGLWRLTFAKHLLDASGNLVSVATLMGHSRLNTTAIHTRASRQDMEWAVERLAEQ